MDLPDLGADPISAVGRWLEDAVASGVPNPDAMVVATADADGVPSARNVLLKGCDERGFVFYTNSTSRKGRELAANPRAALVFRWSTFERQIIVQGPVVVVSDEEADNYFASRPRGSQISAWASPQSEVIPDRSFLEARAAEVSERFAGGDVARPPHWGGYRVQPLSIEFWHGRPDRLHDRIRFRRAGVDDVWIVERLAP